MAQTLLKADDVPELDSEGLSQLETLLGKVRANSEQVAATAEIVAETVSEPAANDAVPGTVMGEIVQMSPAVEPATIDVAALVASVQMSLATETPVPEASPAADASAVEDKIAAANGVVDTDDEQVLLAVNVLTAVVGQQKLDHVIFTSGVSDELIGDLANVVDGFAELSPALQRKKAEVAVDVLRETLTGGKKKRGGKKKQDQAPAASSTNTPAAGTSKPSKDLEWQPVAGHVTYTSALGLAGTRTAAIELPAEILSEAVTTRGTKNRHQIDFSRTEGYAPVMPCAARLRDTGNPYPFDETDPVVQPHGEQYRPFVKISHVTYEVLKAAQIDTTDEAAIKAIVDSLGMAWTKDAKNAVVDTLRDLWSVGLATQETAGGRKRRFTLKTA